MMYVDERMLDTGQSGFRHVEEAARHEGCPAARTNVVSVRYAWERREVDGCLSLPSALSKAYIIQSLSYDGAVCFP
jgi:hypothetical protein